MTTFIEYLQYPFFIRAIAVGGLLGVLLSWMSGYVVLRQEVLFTHALSNIGFLGVALAILLQLPITPMLLATCLIAAYLIRLIQNKRIFQNDSLLETFSQLGLTLGIIVVALFPGYRINIEQFLFGDILGISNFDFLLSLIILSISALLIGIFHKVFLKISLSASLSHTLFKNTKLLHGLLIFSVTILIAVAMKIVGVLLVAAFTTIPSNSAKLFAKNINQTFILSSIIGVISTVSGLYLSILLNLPSGPLVVTVLGLFWVAAIVYHRFRWHT